MFTSDELNTISKAKNILLKKLNKQEIFSTPATVKDFFQLELATEERELFGVMFLDNKHRLIKFETIFYGSISSCSVHPREVVKSALRHNAAAVLFTHNHPSGTAKPSSADKMITEKLSSILDVIDVRVLDHIVVTKSDCFSFAEAGLL